MLDFLKTRGKWVLALGMVILVMVLGILGYYFFGIDKSLIKDLVVVKRTVYGEEKSTGGLLSMNFNQDNQKYQYVNVVVDFNKDGKFSSYQADNQTQEEWVVENMEPKIKKDEGLGLAISLADLNIESRADFPVKIIFSRKKLVNWQGEKKLGTAILLSTIKLIEKNDLSEIYQPDPEKIRSGGFFGNSFTSNASASENDLPQRPANINEEEEALTGDNQSGEVPISDESQSSGEGQQGQPAEKEKTVKSLAKEFDSSHSNMPDLDQKKNECAPTATANSLLWLAAKGDYLDKLPETAPELIAKLKTNFKWNENGIDVKNNYLDGKKATIDQLGLSLETHAVGKPFDLNIVAKIAQEIDKGQDVEIDLAYYKMNPDGTGERTGGHMVTVVGARGTKDAQYLDIHDPATTGENKTETYKINGSGVIGYTSGTTATFIRYAIAESPSTPPTITPSDSSTPTTPTSTSTIISSPKPTSTEITESNATSTTSASPTSTSSSTSTPTATTPTFSGYYDKFFGDSVTTFGVKITPTDLAGKTFNGLEIDHNGQGLPAPYGSNTNLNLTGYDNSGWSCVCTGDKYRCSGSNSMQANVKTVWSLWFDSDINPPSSLNIDLLTDGSVTASTTLNYQ